MDSWQELGLDLNERPGIGSGTAPDQASSALGRLAFIIPLTPGPYLSVVQSSLPLFGSQPDGFSL